jgi:hypothetical protein
VERKKYRARSTNKKYKTCPIALLIQISLGIGVKTPTLRERGKAVEDAGTNAHI